MKSIQESKYVDYGESKFEFIDNASEQMNEVNKRLRETLLKRKAIQAEQSTQSEVSMGE